MMQVPIELVKDAACQIAREDFYSFCRLLYPKFYTAKRTHLKTLCNTLQDFYEDKILDKDGNTVKNLMLLVAPRHGKSFTVQNFCKFMLGKDNSQSAITISYNQSLSIRAGKEVRNAIMERSIEGGKIVYADIFPGTKIKDGDGAQDCWALEGSHFSYLSTSPTGTLTGIGCKWMIIDDLLKSAYEANNELIMDGQFSWFSDTALSRLEAGGKRLIINTRWHVKDISGRLLSLEPQKWHVIKMPACLNEETHEMLCPDILSWDDYYDRKTKTDPQIFEANYNQEPFENVGRLYSKINTYSFEQYPKQGSIECYIDTADTGNDYLCGLIYRVFDSKAYIIDVLYTQDSMDKTEPIISDMIINNHVDKCYIESNSGGMAFSRNIKRIVIDEKHIGYCSIEPFNQSGNKISRILTNANNVSNQILMPEGWQVRWPLFYRDVITLPRIGKWQHDDAPDALSGVIEKSLQNKFAFWL